MSRRRRDNWGMAAAGFMQGLFGGSQLGQQQQMQMDDREARRAERAQAEAFRRQQHADLQAHRKAMLERAGGGGAGGSTDRPDPYGEVNRNLRDMTGRTGVLPTALLKEGAYADTLASLIDKGYTPDRAGEVLKLLDEEQGVELDLYPHERALVKELAGTTGPVKLSRRQLEQIQEDLYLGSQHKRGETISSAWDRAGSFVESHDLTEHRVRSDMANLLRAREFRREQMGEGESGPIGIPGGDRLMGGDQQQMGGGEGSPKAQMLQQQVDQAMQVFVQGGPGARQAREWLNENWVPSQGKKLGIMELPPTVEELEELEAMAAMTQPQGAPIGGHPADSDIMGVRQVNPESRPSGTAGRPAQGQRSGQSQGARVTGQNRGPERSSRERDYERVQAGR